MKPSALIVGAGLAGISTAVHLSSAGFRVTLLEKAPRPGGRTYSFKEPVSGDWLDNGQHILMGCYTETLHLLEMLQTRDRLHTLPPYRAVWIEQGGKSHLLDGNGAFGRLSLLWGLLQLQTLGWKDRWAIIRAMRTIEKMATSRLAHLNNLNCREWLESLHQTPLAIERFWNPLIIATLNEKPQTASADLLAVVVKKAFLADAEDNRIFLPAESLQALFHPAIARYLAEQGGNLHLKACAKRLHIENHRVKSIILANQDRFEADIFILALPPWALANLLPEDRQELSALRSQAGTFQHSPIVSIYIWLNEIILQEPMVGLLESPLHWVFDKPNPAPVKGIRQLLSLVISAAHEIVEETPQNIYELTLKEISRYFPQFRPEQVVQWKVVKERRATVSLRPQQAALRPSAQTPFPNLFLAGDWTNTQLPATIESAVLSGRRAAQYASGQIQKQES